MLQVTYDFLYRVVLDLEEGATVGFVATNAADIEAFLKAVGPGRPELRSITVKET